MNATDKFVLRELTRKVTAHELAWTFETGIGSVEGWNLLFPDAVSDGLIWYLDDEPEGEGVLVSRLALVNNWDWQVHFDGKLIGSGKTQTCLRGIISALKAYVDMLWMRMDPPPYLDNRIKKYEKILGVYIDLASDIGL